MGTDRDKLPLEKLANLAFDEATGAFKVSFLGAQISQVEIKDASQNIKANVQEVSQDVYGLIVKVGGGSISVEIPTAPSDDDLALLEDTWTEYEFTGDPIKSFMFKLRDTGKSLLYSWTAPGEGQKYKTLNPSGIYAADANPVGKKIYFKCATADVVEIEIWR